MAFCKLSPVGPQAPNPVPADAVGLELMGGKLGVLAHAAISCSFPEKNSFRSKFGWKVTRLSAEREENAIQTPSACNLQSNLTQSPIIW